MTFELGGFQLVSGYLASHDDLEGALAERQFWGLMLGACGVTVTEILVGETVESIAAPVEFFLQGDHLTQQGEGLTFICVESGAGQGKACSQLVGQMRVPFLRETIQGGGEIEGLVLGDRKLLQAGARELIEILECDGGLTCASLINRTAFVVEDLFHPEAGCRAVE